MNMNLPKIQKIIIGLVLAALFLTVAYFVGLLALFMSLLWVVWGFVLTLILAIWGWLTALFAGTWLVAFVATITGWITTFFAWFAGTWLGSIFVPIYQLIFPIFAKVAPFFSVGSTSAKLMKWFKKLRRRGEKSLDTSVKEIKKIDQEVK